MSEPSFILPSGTTDLYVILGDPADFFGFADSLAKIGWREEEFASR